MLMISINLHHLGIPLTLVTVAAIAKSLTEFCFKIHYKLWEVWIRFRVYDPNDPINILTIWIANLEPFLAR